METRVPLFIVIGALALVILMIWAFARNAIRMKRDIDRRFDRLRSRLERDATDALEPLLRKKPQQDDSR
jgi:hypothetical protein